MIKTRLSFHITQTASTSIESIAAQAMVIFADSEMVNNRVWIHTGIDESIAQLCDIGKFNGAKEEIEVIPTHKLSPFAYIVMVGLSERSSSVRDWRVAGVQLAKAIRKWKLESVVLVMESHLTEEIEAGYLLTEGLLLGNYQMKHYRHDEQDEHYPCKVTFALIGQKTEAKTWEKQIAKAEIFAEATNYARDLTNLPGNYLIPSQLAEEAVALSREYSLECIVLDEQEIRAHRMGGLYTVGQGSIHPPRMIVLKYQGLEEWKDVIGLVGKGITFDTGGISLKKSEGMEEMISDMGGAATLLGVAQAIGRLKPKINVIIVIPAAENMPSGNAYKPGDLITTMSGKTIEVLNTDAEGRIVLADGMTYAKQLGANKLIDVSTLTGAVLVCLGDVATGAVTNDVSFYQELEAASRLSGEKIWQLPSFAEYWDMLKSEVADVKNATSPNRWAAAITAGLFIGTFAEGTPWIHLDTGGTAWLWSERSVDPKGGTGVMVRTLLHMVCKS